MAGAQRFKSLTLRCAKTSSGGFSTLPSNRQLRATPHTALSPAGSSLSGSLLNMVHELSRSPILRWKHGGRTAHSNRWPGEGPGLTQVLWSSPGVGAGGFTPGFCQG